MLRIVVMMIMNVVVRVVIIIVGGKGSYVLLIAFLIDHLAIKKCFIVA